MALKEISKAIKLEASKQLKIDNNPFRHIRKKGLEKLIGFFKPIPGTQRLISAIEDGIKYNLWW